MLTLERLKAHLRIDGDEEDELLEQYIEAAVSYLSGAADNYRANYMRYPEYASKADMLTAILAAEFYQNRDNSVHDMSYTIRSLMAQLQYFPSSVSEEETIEEISTVEGSTQGGTLAMFDANGNLYNSGIKLADTEDIEKVMEEVGLTVRGGA